VHKVQAVNNVTLGEVRGVKVGSTRLHGRVRHLAQAAVVRVHNLDERFSEDRVSPVFRQLLDLYFTLRVEVLDGFFQLVQEQGLGVGVSVDDVVTRLVVEKHHGQVLSVLVQFTLFAGSVCGHTVPKLVAPVRIA
jgi:hypothetical protein